MPLRDEVQAEAEETQPQALMAASEESAAAAVAEAAGPEAAEAATEMVSRIAAGQEAEEADVDADEPFKHLGPTPDLPD